MGSLRRMPMQVLTAAFAPSSEATRNIQATIGSDGNRGQLYAAFSSPFRRVNAATAQKFQ